MNKDFWLERWERKETGFHQDEINPYLRQFWQELHQAEGDGVFVPLCGKSLDMLWLRSQGCDVIGVELSPVAAQAFFEENGYVPELSSGGHFNCFEADHMRILCGDFFDLKREDLQNVKWVYDRASMVALPPDMRECYVRHLVSVLPPGAQILLVAFDYPQQQMAGPPFAVSRVEIEMHYGEFAQIRHLAEVDVLADNPRFAARGVSHLYENIFLLTLKS